MRAEDALALAKSYVKKSLAGAGALKGDKGEKGDKGDTGKSAYELWLDDGNTGSEDDFLASLKGEKGDKGDTGAQGVKGDTGAQGAQGTQGVQGIQGVKGDDGYPFLIYKEYADIADFNADDFPQIGLMFMIKNESTENFPVYRYTGDADTPYSYVTELSTSESIKGEKGDKGDQGEQGVQGEAGKDGTTYTPVIGTVTTVASNNLASASVTVDRDAKTATFNFDIPKGQDGKDGKDGSGSGGTAEIDVDDEMSDTSENPVQNKVIKKYVDGKAVNVSKDVDNVIETKEDGLYVSKMDVYPPDYVDEEYGITDTPVGHIIAHMGKDAPKHYLACDGTTYAIEDYPYLAQHIKDEFGTYDYFGGNGSTTFAVPDLRGEFLRGTGTNSHENQGNGGEVGEHQDATIHTNVDAHYESGYNYFSASRQLSDISLDLKTDKTINGTGNGRFFTKVTDVNSNDLVGNYTSRPTNTSVLYCIKYEPTYFMQNTYNGNVYSTDEQIVGKWIDGKPIYQKTFDITTQDDYNITVCDLGDGCDLLSFDGYVDGATYRVPLNYRDSGGWLATFGRIGNGHIHKIESVGEGYVGLKGKLTARYTKATD